MDALKKTILITGGSRGIGRAVAAELVRCGANQIFITGRHEDVLIQTANQIGKKWVFPVRCDHSLVSDIEQLPEKTGSVSTIIANVGVNPVHESRPRKVSRTPIDEFEKTIQTNLVHTFALMQLYLDDMKKSNFGRIILLGSQAYRLGVPGQVSYNTSKSGLVGLASTISGEMERYNVKAWVVHPGLVEGERTKKFQKQIKSRKNEVEISSPEEVARRIVTTLVDGVGFKIEVDV
jgi:3-oxoacyl-[acyl-carrier protein] reductase